MIKELTALDHTAHLDEGGTLTAIGRALLQIQQSGAQKQMSIPASSSVQSPASQQIFFSRSSSVPDSGASNGGNVLCRYIIRTYLGCFWC